MPELRAFSSYIIIELPLLVSLDFKTYATVLFFPSWNLLIVLRGYLRKF